MKQIYKRITVLLLVFALLTAAAPVDYIATAVDGIVDLNAPCFLTVHPGGSEYADLQEANVVIDLYKVADAVEIEGYNGYDFANCPDFSELDLKDQQDNEAWGKLAQQATMKIYNDRPQPFSSGNPVKSAIIVDPGLYLVIAHGADVEKPITISKDSEGNDIYISSVLTESREFVFTPCLVTMPGLKAGDEWEYEADIKLKPEASYRYGSLEIIKSLNGYVDGKPATFVFQIEAVKDGKSVYSDVVSITLSEDGQCSELIEDIPIGSEVTVTEIYSGVCYNLITDKTQNVVITAEDISSVQFTNSANDLAIDGGGITNKFEYNGSEGDWNWTQISH